MSKEAVACSRKIVVRTNWKSWCMQSRGPHYTSVQITIDRDAETVEAHANFPLNNPHGGSSTDESAACGTCTREWKQYVDGWTRDIEAADIHESGKKLRKKALKSMPRDMAYTRGLASNFWRECDCGECDGDQGWLSWSFQMLGLGLGLGLIYLALLVTSPIWPVAEAIDRGCSRRRRGPRVSSC